MSQFSCNVVGCEDLSSSVFRLSLEPERRTEFSPGQALKLRIPLPGHPGAEKEHAERFFSIASPPEWPRIELCIKQVGEATLCLRTLPQGSALSAEGPFGKFTLRPSPGKHFVFIAMGTGIAPIRSMLLSRTYTENLPLSTTVIAGFRSEKDVLFGDDLGRLPYASWDAVVSRPETGATPGQRVTDRLRSRDGIAWNETEFYICGSADLVRDVRSILEERGVADGAIHHEEYLRPKKD